MKKIIIIFLCISYSFAASDQTQNPHQKQVDSFIKAVRKKNFESILSKIKEDPTILTRSYAQLKEENDYEHAETVLFYKTLSEPSFDPIKIGAGVCVGACGLAIAYFVFCIGRMISL